MRAQHICNTRNSWLDAMLMQSAARVCQFIKHGDFSSGTVPVLSIQRKQEKHSIR